MQRCRGRCRWLRPQAAGHGLGVCGAEARPLAWQWNCDSARFQKYCAAAGTSLAFAFLAASHTATTTALHRRAPAHSSDCHTAHACTALLCTVLRRRYIAAMESAGLAEDAPVATLHYHAWDTASQGAAADALAQQQNSATSYCR